MKMKYVGNNKFENFVEGDTFRVCSVTRLTGVGPSIYYYEVVDKTEEIAIQKKGIEDTWYTIAIVKWDPIDEIPTYLDVAFKILDALKPIGSNSEFYNCVEFAYKMMWDLHEEDE